MGSVTYKNYKIKVYWYDLQGYYYPYITDEEDDVVYDGIEEDWFNTEAEAITKAKTIIDTEL